MTLLMLAPTYVLARAAWIPTLVIWHADGAFTRLEGAPPAGSHPRSGIHGRQADQIR